jgi:hypothetical protein
MAVDRPGHFGLYRKFYPLFIDAADLSSAMLAPSCVKNV